ncbi:MAG: hypothetical protein NC182_06565 [Prevotella sp.]|nr:hypothetical protein [Staphylococcus sp.]MCM1350849.1 hypothetical protein [Prevotella sp.]
MAKICNAKVNTSSGGYNRVFDNKEIGQLMAKVQSTVISNGNELEKIILSKTNNILDLEEFIENVTIGVKPNGTYVCTKRILKKSKYKLDGNEPDLLIFIIQQRRICKIIELKDGDSFDTKKASGEHEHLEAFSLHFGAKIPFVVDYYICCFNQLSKEAIVTGFKNQFSLDHVMTGKELCEILEISYEDILEERKKDASDNIIYFYEELISIPAISELIKKEKQ